jgi:ATP-dependent Lon protease
MKRAISDLSAQIGLLTEELRRLRGDGERNSGLMELLLAEQRLFQVEEKIQDALDQKAVLDARELDLQRRMKNIPQELLYRAALRREEAEAQIRAELQKALDDVHSQQTSNHQRMAGLQAQADRLRRRGEVLRRKYEQREVKAEEDKQK